MDDHTDYIKSKEEIEALKKMAFEINAELVSYAVGRLKGKSGYDIFCDNYNEHVKLYLDILRHINYRREGSEKGVTEDLSTASLMYFHSGLANEVDILAAAIGCLFSGDDEEDFRFPTTTGSTAITSFAAVYSILMSREHMGVLLDDPISQTPCFSPISKTLMGILLKE